MRALTSRAAAAVLLRRAALPCVAASLYVPRLACSTTSTPAGAGAAAGAAAAATGEGADAASNAAKAAAAGERPEEVVSLDAFRKVEKELEQARQLADELQKDVLYRAADAENARRIGREDAEKAKLYSVTAFAKDMLELADTLEKAIAAFDGVANSELKDNKTVEALLAGVRLSYRVLQTNLGRHGVRKMNVTHGIAFDPNVHDALVRTAPSDTAPHDTISHVMKDGYMIHDRVLRAAQVGVAHHDA